MARCAHGSGSRATPALPLLAVLTLLAPHVVAGDACAHLSLIRQGAESAQILESNDRTGSALAVGDFDGDGYDDLAIGAPGETLGGIAGTGLVVIVYGSRRGLTHEGSVSRSAASVGGTNNAGAGFGAALASGDFNGDTYADLAIGAPFEPVSGTDDAGRVYVLHGAPTGLASAADTNFTETAGGGGIELGDEFGAALAAGDFNGDGRDDLAIGAPGEDLDAGAIFQFPGSAGGITRVGAGFFKQSNLGGTNASNDRFGHALATGDLFGDAKEDLAASAPFRAILPATLAGVVYLLPGSATGLTSAGALSYSADNPDTPQSSGRFGYALAVGQFGAGAYRSLAIGEPGRDVSGMATAGRVVSVHGSAAGLDWGATGFRVITQAFEGTVSDLDRFGWSLAAGDRWSAAIDTFGTDGYDELAVGVPFDSDTPSGVDAGLVQILHSTSTNVIGAGAEIYTQVELGDSSETGDQLGVAVAMGRFDETGFANTAAGAPLENTSDDLKYDAAGLDVEEFADAGCVYVCAPWRQVLNLGARGTVVFNCQSELVFSQRPFDRVRPASTTKIMTVLLACERMDAAHPEHVDSSSVHEVPFWVKEIGGSTADLGFCERMRFIDVARACLSVSGNDAAYFLGDIMEPEPRDTDVSLFVDAMNARAGEFGMTGTRFSNPSGRDTPEDDLVPLALQDNYTTPFDMVLLGREAMFNPLFHDLAGIETWDMTRDLPNEIAIDCEDVTERVDVPWTYANSFIAGMRNQVAEASGVKPGGTTAAKRTRVISADKATGRVISARFGIGFDKPRGAEDEALLALGAALCDDPIVLNPGADPFSDPYMRRDDVPTHAGARAGGLMAYRSGETDSTQVAVYHRSGSGPATLRLSLARVSEARLLPQSVADFTLAPFQDHAGFRLVNPETVTVPVRVTASHPPLDVVIPLAPGGEAFLPAFAGPLQSQFHLTIRNVGMTPATIEIEELEYGFEIAVGSVTPGPGPFSTLLNVSGPVELQSLSVSSLGRDANPGNTVLLVAHAPNASLVSADPFEPHDPGRSVSLVRPPWPNPFRSRVQLRFEAHRPGAVRLGIYDVRGREVWSRGTTLAAPGPWQVEWNGIGSAGRVAPGLYFFRLFFEGRPVESGRILRLTP
ncbi:MAG: hypothetical protein ACREOU_14500 [Candidatus Eiseniibacteriota bacterium]